MQQQYPKLNLPTIELKIRKSSEKERLLVWASTRKCYLVLTPEEWVRRHFVAYLVSGCGAQPEQICEEYPVMVNGLAQRADVVVMDSGVHPLMLVECKAPTVAIDAAVYAQAVRYNAIVGARYVVLTNGMKHLCFELTANGYKPMTALAKF